jgi:hydroxymethylglutaryl-CoA lyase
MNNDIILFDVSLRDGLQSANPENWSTEKKMIFFDNLINKRNPKKCEIGSLVSPKILPIMNDSIDLYNRLTSKYGESIDLYLLIPSFPKFVTAINHGICCFSFITSISEEFQLKNTRKTISENKIELSKIIGQLPVNSKTKLYISCISECPISGKQDNEKIVEEICSYFVLDKDSKIDEYCLSDTCGSLLYCDFKIIIDKLLSKISADKISLHLHISSKLETSISPILNFHQCKNSETKEILSYAIVKGIRRFDVSELETGGCSVTMNSCDCLPNLSYDLFM